MLYRRVRTVIFFTTALVLVAAVAISAWEQRHFVGISASSVAMPALFPELQLGGAEKSLAKISLPGSPPPGTQQPPADILSNRRTALHLNRAARQLAPFRATHYHLVKQRLAASFPDLDRWGLLHILDKLVDYYWQEQHLMGAQPEDSEAEKLLELIDQRGALQEKILGKALAQQFFAKQMQMERTMIKIRIIEASANLTAAEKQQLINALLATSKQN